MTNDSSSDMKCYADLLQLNRKVKIMSRACDDTKFVGEVDINAGLKWWLRGAQGIHINIWRCISSPPLQWPPVLVFLSTRRIVILRGGRGWHGGIGMMNDEKDGMVEKACTV